MTKILAITGGVGGAKLALGLSKILNPDELLFLVNTGDDFQHLGLEISPDLDSLLYALSGKNNPELGWGRANETWACISELEELGADSWFRLGDRDLALHLVRTQMLNQGATLQNVADRLSESLGIDHRIAPMSNDKISTTVNTPNGKLAFQEYFVREQCEPAVIDFDFEGIEKSTPNPVVMSWLDECDGIIICPSNPYVSVDTILSVPKYRDAFQSKPVIAVSPIVGGLAIKGPAAKMMTELGVPPTPIAVAKHYGSLLSGFVLDQTDHEQAKDIPIPSIVTQTIMLTLQDRIGLAEQCVRFLEELT
ncbi:MAG: 2-phospho-L-lactate transferase [Gammaproteobacteria bacterium]|nr:2-phospho-L-lactate transferase [Gammaproteobacteria bacterium]|tara:strand:- start:292 stop:1215 length:924 start_codon:yes stop_codon:yes gene_type:complete